MAPYLNLKDIGGMEITLLPLEEQERIGEVLGALDDKIATNMETVKSADHLRSLVWSRLTHNAPMKPLSSLGSFVNGGAYTRGATGNGRPVLRIAELNSGIGNSTVWTDLEVPPNHTVRPGDLLLSWSGSILSHRWTGPESILNQHIFKVLPKEDIPTAVMASFVDEAVPTFKSIAADKATTMGHIKRGDLDILIHCPRLTEEESHDLQNLWDLALAKEMENTTLAATRDELLPLLMSGKITVKDAEKRVEEEV